jgi:hypothetical protein
MHVISSLKGVNAAMVLAAVLFTAGVADATTTINPDGDLNGPRTIATVSITTECTSGQSATLTVYIFQSVGRLINIGIGTAAFTCSGGSDVSTVDVSAIPGLKFQPGPATLLVHTETDDGLGTITKSDSGAKVKLHP